MNRIWMGILILIGLTINTHFLVVVVDAQLFIDCVDGGTDYGNPYEACVYNTTSPLSVPLDDGSMVSFGTESYAVIYCLFNSTRSPFSCACDIIVNPSDPVAENDYCNWCAVVAVSDTEFIPSFDCSNRLVGDCVGVDSDGICIDNSGSIISSPPSAPNGTTVTTPRVAPVPAPVRAPVPVPRPSPTKLPVAITTLDPTLLPDISPFMVPPTVRDTNENPIRQPVTTTIPTTSTRGQDISSGNFTIIGLVVGCVGGLFLAAVIVFLMMLIQRKKHTKNETNKSVPLEDLHAAPNFDDTSSPPRSSRTTLGMSDTSTIASLVRPTTTNPPLLYPMADTLSNTPYAAEILEPQKCDTLHPYPVNPLLHVKDQCRDVALVRVPTPMSLSPSDSANTNMPFAMPVGDKTATHEA